MPLTHLLDGNGGIAEAGATRLRTGAADKEEDEELDLELFHDSNLLFNSASELLRRLQQKLRLTNQHNMVINTVR